MGQIKSALELALERTKDIQGDREGLEAKEFREQGMKLVAKAEHEPDLDVAAELKKTKDKQLVWVKEGMRQVLMGYLNLPSGIDPGTRLAGIKRVFVALASKPKEMTTMLDELEKFFTQYTQQKEQVVAAVRQQLEPNIRQKEDAVFQQTGRRVRVSIESDPEFSRFLSMNLDKLQSKYEAALAQVKEEILGLIS